MIDAGKTKLSKTMLQVWHRHGASAGVKASRQM
jgi:hypothetical protein